MTRRTLKLDTPANVRRALAKVANLVYRGELDPKIANTFILACNAILSGIRTDEQEKRILELEEILNNRDY